MAARTEYGQWTAKQSDFLPLVPPEAIPHGAIFPIPIIKEHLPGGIIVELGAGRGASAESIEAGGYGWMGVEINKDAVSDTRNRGNVSFQGDVRDFWASSINLAAITMIENAGGVLLQGLLANIIENRDIRRVLRTADIFLRPGGFLFIAEPIRFDQADLGNEDAIHAGFSLRQWRERWKTRYALNEAASLPRGVFAVAKPGPEKDILDWPHSVDDVRALISSDQMERFARHVNEHGVIAYARRLHLALKDRQPSLLFSRNGEPLPGAFMTFRKEYGVTKESNDPRYRYSPWYRGMTSEERHAYQDVRGERAHSNPNYFDDYWERMRKNFPPSMQPPKTYTI